MWVLGIEPRTPGLTLELSLQLQIHYIFIHKVFKCLPDRILLEQCPQFPLLMIFRVTLLLSRLLGVQYCVYRHSRCLSTVISLGVNPSLPESMSLCLDALSIYQK